MPGLDAGQNGGRDEGDEKGEQDRQQDPAGCERDLPLDIGFSLGVAEEQLAHEGREAGREHAYVQVLIEVQPLEAEVEKGRQKAGPHVEIIEAVEAVRDHQKITRQGVHVRGAGQEKHEACHGQAAEPRIEEGRRKAPQSKVIRDGRRRRREDPEKIRRQGRARVCVESAGKRGRQQGGRKAEGDAVDQHAVALDADFRDPAYAVLTVVSCFCGLFMPAVLKPARDFRGPVVSAVCGSLFFHDLG